MEEGVVNTLDRIAVERGLRATIKVDSGSECIPMIMFKWAYERGDLHKLGTTFRVYGQHSSFIRTEKVSVLIMIV